MTRRYSSLALTALATAVLATGCGSDNKDAGTQVPTISTGASTIGRDAQNTPTGGAPAPQTAIDGCKRSVDANPRLSEEIRKELAKLCETAGSGDAAAAREASKKVCQKILEGSIPAGPARETALKSCDQPAQ